VREDRDPAEHIAGRITAFSLTLLLVPTLALVWVRYVWQEYIALGFFEILRRTGLIVAAGLLAYLVLRLAGKAVAALVRNLEVIDRRRHPWRH